MELLSKGVVYKVIFRYYRRVRYCREGMHFRLPSYSTWYTEDKHIREYAFTLITINMETPEQEEDISETYQKRVDFITLLS